ncbi:MAG: PEGA domain-containing protein, partial [Acidobacteriota bacterium]
MKQCGKCGAEYPEEYVYCPVDGAPFGSEPPAQKLGRPEPAMISVRALMIGLMGLMFAGALAFAGTFFYLYFKPKYGSLEIKTTPPDAVVYLDGKQAGVTPLTLQNLRSGGHQIRVVKEGYQEAVQTVQVIPYATENLH